MRTMTRPSTPIPRIHPHPTPRLTNPIRKHGLALPILPVLDAAGSDIGPGVRWATSAGITVGVGGECGGAFSGRELVGEKGRLGIWVYMGKDGHTRDQWVAQ